MLTTINKIKSLSAVIITWNEEHTIGRCFDSRRHIADEVIVLDSYSSDNTIAIASQKGAIIKQEKFSGYKQQKNKALQLPAHDYAPGPDADEVLTTKPIGSIPEVKKDFKHKAYFMNRYNNYCRRFIKHGSWYSNQKLSLFNGYFLRLGLLDGYCGFVIAVQTANQSYLKYQKLRRVQKQHKKVISWDNT